MGFRGSGVQISPSRPFNSHRINRLERPAILLSSPALAGELIGEHRQALDRFVGQFVDLGMFDGTVLVDIGGESHRKVSLVREPPDGSLNANRTAIGAWEKFRVTAIP